MIGNFAAQTNASPFEAGQATQAAESLNRLLLDAATRAGEDSDTAALRAGGGKGGSLLMRIAIALGKLLD